MPFLTIQASGLTHEKKEILAAQIAQGFSAIGIPPQSVLLKFEDLHLEYVTETGLRCIDARPETPALPALAAVAPVAAPAPVAASEPQAGGRKKHDQATLLKLLVEHFKRQPEMNSFDVQQHLGLKQEKNPGAVARGLLEELVARGIITKSGQRRGTKYHYSPDPDMPAETPSPILVKQDAEEVPLVPAEAQPTEVHPEVTPAPEA